VRRSVARLLTIPAAAAVATGTALAAASPAFADVTDTGGSATVTEPFSYIAQLAKAGAVQVPLPPAMASVDTTNKVVNTTFPVTGGNADATTLSGTLNLGGSLKVITRKGRVTLTNVTYSMDSETINATPAGSSTPIALLDLGGAIVVTPNGTSQSVTASELDVDPAGAAYLDSALHTSAFVAGQNAGSFSASWTVSGS
jgi:hypothetical protein